LRPVEVESLYAAIFIGKEEAPSLDVQQIFNSTIVPKIYKLF
jgi:hypothetical protein